MGDMKSKVVQRTAAPAMSRGARTARGAAISLAATLLAAASHAIAGGEVTALSILATTVFALPVSMAIVGQRPALWRLTIAVGIAQFLYHWCFAGFGLLSGQGNASAPTSLHAAHMLQGDAFVPDLATAAAAGTAMWLSHALAAVITIALLYRGEVAYRLVAQLVRRVLPSMRIAVVAVPRPVAVTPTSPVETPRWLAHLTAITHRGPPAVSCAFSM